MCFFEGIGSFLDYRFDSVCLHILIVFVASLVYFPRFEPWEMYLALHLYCRLYFVLISIKMALINLDLHSITLFWQLKFWASFWAGNHPSYIWQHCLWAVCLCSFLDRFLKGKGISSLSL